ncbi:MAG: GNAT family N-acetyltransferase [Candidatus Zhuqueibacterota bacterium]
MTQSSGINLVHVNAENVDQTGFFCYMSKRKSEGYARKLNWLKARFEEGLRIKMLELPQRGFIEYIPGEFAWRAVHAENYMVIHCLWVVGQSRGQGLASYLVDACIRDARECGKSGVAMVTSERVWLMGRKLLDKLGFQSVAEYPPFNLMVKKFDDAPLPTFCGDWQEKAGRFGEGFMVIRSDQCPYVPDATDAISKFASERRSACNVIELRTSDDVRNVAPSPYGVFSIVHDGKLLAYHYLLPKDLEKLFP